MSAHQRSLLVLATACLLPDLNLGLASISPQYLSMYLIFRMHVFLVYVSSVYVFFYICLFYVCLFHICLLYIFLLCKLSFIRMYNLPYIYSTLYILHYVYVSSLCISAPRTLPCTPPRTLPRTPPDTLPCTLP